MIELPGGRWRAEVEEGARGPARLVAGRREYLLEPGAAVVFDIGGRPLEDRGGVAQRPLDG